MANLHQLKAHFLFGMRAYLRNLSLAQWPDPQIFHFLNEAQRAIQDELKIRTRVSASASFADGTAAYDAPSNLHGAQIEKVELYVNGEWDTAGIPQKGFAVPDTTTTSTPTSWAWSKSDAGQIVFYGTPDASTATAYRLTYLARPSVLRRIWAPVIARATAALTADSTAVLLSENADTNWFAAGDELGMVRTESGDATTLTDQLPYEWYKVDSVLLKAVVLARTWSYTTETAARFITAQVPDFEKAYPGKFGFLLADYAVMLALRMSEPQKAQLAQMSVYETMSRFSLDDERVQGLGRREQAIYPQGFRRTVEQ